MRASGAAIAPAGGPGAPASTTPLPIRGSPPPALQRAPLTTTTVYASSRLVPQQVLDGDRLPSWQALPGGNTPSVTPATARAHRGGCGCRSCRGY
jgi:hypothetical protein